MLRFASLLLLLLSLAPLAHAQTAEPRRVVLTDGSVIVGTVDDESADPVVVRTADGIEQRIPRERVQAITPLVGGRFTTVDPTRTRTLVAPTARTLGRGETRLGTTAYILPTVTTGVAERVDLYGSGLFAFDGFGGGGGALVVGAKGQILNTGSAAVAIGSAFAIPFGSGSDVNGSFLALPYGVATLGDETRAVSLGVTGFIGGSVDSGDVEAGEGVVVSAGGEVQVGNHVKLLADVFVPVGSGDSAVLVLPGVRFFGSHFSADVYGIIGAAEGDVGGFAPLANFSYRF